ncbi:MULTISPECIES: type III secretion system chaperone [unclassified Variovorax]|uniref:type III secretion system chaperone n=1 Tax=unclassified Variovorax TaxID=663243 RepID=UPI00076D203A|nr:MULTISPECIES: type III secretion system chaperone [unclassified Variovorax]KWT83850.1 hypothetical protein APY03_4405 [Variovorax sp. WDL1]PNG46529.1 hypothetical protein CHC06_06871 [Variovorax sp. B2]PNG47649.1 hypothetical protein CHC07_06816 [Variovorax sp. B4]VTV14290.1 hypothetical protein WDL1CHR_04844 [Variovorax sp. WDL1]
MPWLTPHDIEVAFNEATNAEPELGTVTSLDNSSWLIELASGDDILAEWVTSPPRLVFTTALGRLEPEHELLAYKLALTYNAQGHHNGTLRLGRDHEDGDLLLMADMYPTDSAVSGLAQELMRLEASRVLWEAALQGIRHSEPDEPSGIDAAGLRI